MQQNYSGRLFLTELLDQCSIAGSLLHYFKKPSTYILVNYEGTFRQGQRDKQPLANNACLK